MDRTSFFITIKTYPELELNLIDHVVLNQVDGKEQKLFDRFVKQLDDYPVALVKVICPIEELRKRELSRGDRKIGNAEWQLKQGLYPLEGYVIIVNTYTM